MALCRWCVQDSQSFFDIRDMFEFEESWNAKAWHFGAANHRHEPVASGSTLENMVSELHS